jgi:hypothetical protein
MKETLHILVMLQFACLRVELAKQEEREKEEVEETA